jgi:hypothetical protein
MSNTITVSVVINSDPMPDDRRVQVLFAKDGDSTIITESFDLESENS